VPPQKHQQVPLAKNIGQLFLANPSNCPSHCIYRSACHRSNSPFAKPPDHLQRRRHSTKVSTQYAHNHHSSCTPFTATTCPFKNSNNSMYNKLQQCKQAAFVIPLLLLPAPPLPPSFCPRTRAAFWGNSNYKKVFCPAPVSIRMLLKACMSAKGAGRRMR